jgi:pimeloyl-ACP methyl ester carboxylesterase
LSIASKCFQESQFDCVECSQAFLVVHSRSPLVPSAAGQAHRAKLKEGCALNQPNTLPTRKGLPNSVTTLVKCSLAIACFGSGVILAHWNEPGVHVEPVTIAGDSPALKFTPAGSGPHPVALLAHGYTGTKENLFCYGEALATTGFVCFSVDQPGHGVSLRQYSLMEAVRTLEDVARAIGPVDVYIGHSMGGFTGGEAVREGRLPLKLFIAVGSSPHLGERGPPLLLLAGRFEEFFTPAELNARTDARLVLSPWSNHGLELFDPLLVNAAVEAACSAVGKPPPVAPSSWIWRVLGLAFGLLGALGLTLLLPRLPSRLAWMRGLLVAAIFIVAFILTAGDWLDVLPHLRFFPLQFTATAIVFLVLVGAGRLRIPRWGLLALSTVVWAICMATGANLPGPRGVVVSTFLLPAFLLGTVLGKVAAHRGSRRDGDIAMAIIVGCALFQWARPPKFAETPFKQRVAIKLDTKLYDACVGQYEFPPDNVFPNGMNLTIRRQGEQLVGQALGRHVYQGAFDIYPESETNFFLKANGAQLIFLSDDKRQVNGVISRSAGVPDSEGKKLKSK